MKVHSRKNIQDNCFQRSL